MLIPEEGDASGFDVVARIAAEIIDASTEVHLRSSLSFTHDVFSSRLFRIVHHRGF
jgi:hypothetical protein